ncbi:MAG: 16S rRNA (uracil(1498)-N(3))-methyltransferase [Bacteroidetes bacterium]|nr:16S rRNA (uracil(1498)-N(3))-methyltransferase [Bacteroidota bacterium]
MQDTPYFFEENISLSNEMIQLNEENSHHIQQVLRLKSGSEIVITNGKGVLLHGAITWMDKKKTIFHTHTKDQTIPPINKISICSCVLKNIHRFEWFLEKAVEIGVSEIIPVISKRTEKKNVRHDRMKQIMKSALMQSKQSWLPVLQEPLSFEKAILLEGFDYKYIAHCEEAEKSNLHADHSSGHIQMLIGPEGDFTPEEIEMALTRGFTPVSLGRNRLRSETAALVALALLNN